jgi:hypothetical protein
MVKPRVYGMKYIKAVQTALSGVLGAYAQKYAEDYSTQQLYLALNHAGYYWDAEAEKWGKATEPAAPKTKVNRSLFGALPVNRHLAVRIVCQTERINNLIAATTDLYEMLDAKLIKVTGPVVAKRGKGKSMAYLYFSLPL